MAAPWQVIGYLRVSTKGQGESGLGLEGQKAAIDAYVKQAGANVLARRAQMRKQICSTYLWPTS